MVVKKRCNRFEDILNFLRPIFSFKNIVYLQASSPLAFFPSSGSAGSLERFFPKKNDVGWLFWFINHKRNIPDITFWISDEKKHFVRGVTTLAAAVRFLYVERIEKFYILFHNGE